MARTYSISELAREFAVTPRTIRFYEAEGLIAPLREGQRRIYRPRDRIRLKLILRGKRLGFSLKEIAEIVDLYEGPPGEFGQLETLLPRIAAKRAELLERRADIDAALAHLDSVAAGCRAQLAALGAGSSGDGASQNLSAGAAK
ncbi:MAG: MerR family DNA-binding transcriptional regulator [Kiloniellales bacterium]